MIRYLSASTIEVCSQEEDCSEGDGLFKMYFIYAV